MVSLRPLHPDEETRDCMDEGDGDSPSRSSEKPRCENSSHVISW